MKAKHEATIVEGKAIESKGGSIRYTLRGEYKGRKTLPKTVTKADFEGIYGFDAKEAEAVIMTGKLDGKKGKVNIFNKVGEKDDGGFKPETIVPIEKEDDLLEAFRENAVAPDGTKIKDLKDADTVGSPSPATINQPAPSEDPFPQEPSNASFSAEDLECVECGEMGAIECDTCDDICEECHRNSWGQDGYGAMDMALGHLTTEQIAELYDEDPNDLEALLDEYSYQGNDEADAIYDRFVKSMHSKTETKEAFGFGKEDEEDEEEEEAEPTTQEFTVIMQEGDKLELTDIEEDEEEEEGSKDEDNGEDEENEEKEAEEGTRTFKITDIRYDTYDEEADEQQTQEDLELPSEMTLSIDLEGDEEHHDIYDILTSQIENQGHGWLVESFSFDAENYEAVSAKVTRPVKEEEDEESEDGEGMSTLAKVGLGVGALAVGAAILGAEDEGESDYWAGENAHWRAETAETFSASGDVSVGQKRIQSRKDYDIENEYDTDLEVGDIDLDDYNDELENQFNDELVDAIRESVDDSMPISDGETGSGSVDVNTDIDITVPVSGEVNFDWTSHEENEEDVDSEWDAETFEARTTRKSIRHHPITDRPDYDTAGAKMIILPDGKDFSGKYERTPRNKKGRKRLSNPKKMDWDNANLSQDFTKTKKREKEDLRNIKKHGHAENFSADSQDKKYCIGCGTPSGYPHSLEKLPYQVGLDGKQAYSCRDCFDEVREAESKEAESKNLKMALGITAVGIGLAAILGKDKLSKLFDRFNL